MTSFTVDVEPIPIDSLMPLWERIEEFGSQRAFEQADTWYRENFAALTDRRFDEAKPAGEMTYIAARQLMVTAYQHHQAFRREVEHHGLTPFVSWTLLRSVFEASCWVHWLLEPDDDLVRRQRGLRRNWRDLIEYHEWHETFAGSAHIGQAPIVAARADYQEKTRAMEQLAKDLGTSPGAAKARINFTKLLPQLRVAEEISPPGGAGLLVSYWKHQCGHTHGFSWAVVAGSVTQRQVPIPGGQYVTVTVNPNAFLTNAQITGVLLLLAVSRYVRRTTHLSATATQP